MYATIMLIIPAALLFAIIADPPAAQTPSQGGRKFTALPALQKAAET
jgi:hypothetical protein